MTVDKKYGIVIVDMQERYRKLAEGFSDSDWWKAAKNLVDLVRVAKSNDLPVFTFEFCVGENDQTVPQLKSVLMASEPPIVKTEMSVFSAPPFYFHGGRPKNLQQHLSHRGITNLVIGGTHTYCCVLDSILDGLQLSFKIHTAGDILLPAAEKYELTGCLNDFGTNLRLFHFYSSVPELLEVLV